MASSQIIILAIIATSLATFISRFMGALTSEKVSVKSKLFQWFNCVAYSTLAALLGRMIIFPAGVLAESDLIIRLVVVVICVVIFILSKKNLVIPTIVSGRITLGIMNQILRAFGQVASSFQFLVSSWTTIIELISIYKRLKAFEAAINDQPLPKIDRDFVEDGSKEV